MKTTRREFLGMAGFAVGSAALFTVTGKLPANAEINRPPGVSSEEDFLQKCMRCHQCIYVCQRNTEKEEKKSADVLFAVPLSKGFTVVNTPERIETADKKCTNCSRCRDACPSGAIPAAGEGAVVQIIADLCVGCFHCTRPGVCAENAITFNIGTGWPVVDYAKCTGCGNCLTKCAEDGQTEETAIEIVASKNEVAALPAKNDKTKVAHIIPVSGNTGCQRCSPNTKYCVTVCQEETEHKALTRTPLEQYPGFDVSKCSGCGDCLRACIGANKLGIEMVLKSSLT
ncbi:MAG: 4Fe-4S dicluster domain-containing protein [Clostridiales bacterium]|nr:4Fe-4S dicluster domain-containing protein [Clostridiales bacterium]